MRLPSQAPFARGCRASDHQASGSGPVSRILSSATIYLGPPSPTASRGHTRASAGPALTAPIRPCTRWGLPSRYVTAALVRSYRTVSAFLPHEAGESSFLWHFPSRRRALPLAGTLPCGVRTFLTCADARAVARPTPITFYNARGRPLAASLIFGSPYGIRTRDLRLERAVS